MECVPGGRDCLTHAFDVPGSQSSFSAETLHDASSRRRTGSNSAAAVMTTSRGSVNSRVQTSISPPPSNAQSPDSRLPVTGVPHETVPARQLEHALQSGELTESVYWPMTPWV